MSSPRINESKPISDEQNVSKAEKLRRRQEQLTAWKLKKQSENEDPKSVINTSDEKASASITSKQEMLNKRRAKLEAWKRKKEQEIPSESSNNAPSSGVSSIEDEKKLLRQQKIDEWKKNRLLKATPIDSDTGNNVSKERPKSTPSTFTIKASLKDRISVSTQKKKRPVFSENDDEDENSKPHFKKPTLDFIANENETYNGEQATNVPSDDTNDIDELDKYIDSLNDSSKTTSIEILPQVQDNEENDNQLAMDENEMIDSGNEGSDEDQEQQKLILLKLKLQHKEKDLEVVDHSEIEYKPFRKNFYKESPELSKLLQEEVDAKRLKLDDIKVRGVDCPKPISKWSQLGLSSSVMSIIENKLKYTKPSSIQAQALPTIMSGRDMIGIAKTGSGKTISFVLPLIRHILDQPPLKQGDGPIGLIMTPTRELALQIYKELSNFTKKVDITACCCYGGSPIESQIADLKKGTQVIVGTPGRIIDLLAANGGRVTNLRRTTYLVLDEADRMFDMGFEPQVTKVFTQVRPDRQTVLFSATFPKKMELLAMKVLINPVEISVGGISVVASEISQKIELFEVNQITNKLTEELESSKFTKLLEIIQNFLDSKVLIFVEKQGSADDLLVKLLSAKHACLAIHGAKDQMDRKHAIKEFSSPKSGVDILIATSIAARGLDVKGLDLVINYDAPNHMEDYVHRVGRTGRAGKKGTAITFVDSKQERAIADLVRAMRMSKMEEHDISPRLIEISDNFSKKLKSGKEKFYLGFGGRGLDNLQEIRENTRDIERRVYGGEDVEETDGTNNNEATNRSKDDGSLKSNVKSKFDLEIPDFQVIEGRAAETAGPDRCKFHSRITINDLPQRARLIVLNRESLSRIIESTSTSITNKGQYYASKATMPKTVKKNGNNVTPPPKLYLLVEGLTEKAVHDANTMIRQRMIQGLEAVARDETIAPTGKYTV